MKELDFYISKNGRYMMLENVVYDAVKDRHAHIDEISFSDLIEIIGENVNFMVQKLNSNISEISSFTRKNVYHVLEYFETDSKLSLMVEYETKFGSLLLTEGTVDRKKLIEETWVWIKEKTQILEQTLNPFNKDFYTSSNWKKAGEETLGAAKNVATGVGNFVKDPVGTTKKGIQWVKENGFPAMMEKIRDGLSSGTGIAIQIFAQMTGVGNIGVGIVWGSMLLYDLWKVFTDKDWNFLDILFDALGILSTGAAKGLKIAAQEIGVTGKGGAAGLKSGMAKLAKSPKTAGYMKTLSNGISTVIAWLEKSGAWLSKNLGIKWISDVLGKAKTWIVENITGPINTWANASKATKGTKAVVTAKAQTDAIGDIASTETGQNIINKTSNFVNRVTGKINPEDMSSSIATQYSFK